MARSKSVHWGQDAVSGVRVIEFVDGFAWRVDCTAANIPSGKVGYKKGCELTATDTGAKYRNTGTTSSCTFTITQSVAVDLSGLTATSTELNTLSGFLGSTTQLNENIYAAGRIVNTTGTQLTVTAALHSGKDVLLNNTHTQTVTMPAASGSGDRYSFIVVTLGTDGSKIVTQASTADIFMGASIAVNTQSTTLGFQTTNATTVTFNNTTTGGKIGSKIEITDVASGVFATRVFAISSGNPATPFS